MSIANLHTVDIMTTSTWIVFPVLEAKLAGFDAVEICSSKAHLIKNGQRVLSRSYKQQDIPEEKSFYDWFAYITGESDSARSAPPGATHLADFYGRVSYYQKVERSHLNQVSEEWQTLARWNVWEKGAWVDAGAGFSSHRLKPLASLAENDGPSARGLSGDALPINWVGSSRWTMDRGAMPGEPFAFLDGDGEDAAAAMYEMQSPGKPVFYEVRLPGGVLLSRADAPAEAAQIAESLMGDPDGDTAPQRPRSQG